jgi:large subunit ribosomal protein L18Ae
MASQYTPSEVESIIGALARVIQEGLTLETVLLIHHPVFHPFVETVSMLHEYQVSGRKLPSTSEPSPQLYKMRIFASNEIVAKSRFWYFLSKLKKIKRTAGEIVAFNEVLEKKPLKVKNFGVWLRYDSRSGTHNMYKEFRAMSRSEAVQSCCIRDGCFMMLIMMIDMDMAARHRARFRSIHIIKVSELTTAQVRRPYIQQLIVLKIIRP